MATTTTTIANPATTDTTTNVAQYTPTNATAVNATGTGYNATGDGSVANQVSGIIASNSPLMQQAKTTSDQNMNARGLLNSSMADTAGQSAVINAALPIAQSDAASTNAASQFTANAANTADLQNSQLGTNTNLTNANAANTADQANTTAQNSLTNTGVAAAAQQQIASIEAQYKNLTQGSASAASIVNNAQSQISAIVSNTTMDAAAKTAAINDIKTNLTNSMNMVGALAGDVNLGQYINQATA